MLDIGIKIDGGHLLRHHQQHGKNVRLQHRFPDHFGQPLQRRVRVGKQGLLHVFQTPAIFAQIVAALGETDGLQPARRIKFIDPHIHQAGIGAVEVDLFHVDEAALVLHPHPGTKLLPDERLGRADFHLLRVALRHGRDHFTED